MTLLTRGKKPVTFQIPDDTDDAYARYKDAVKHIAVDRQDTPALAEALSDKAFDGVLVSAGHIAAAPPPYKLLLRSAWTLVLSSASLAIMNGYKAL